MLATLACASASAGAAEAVDIGMEGRPDGSHVWFDPIGIHVAPGTTVRWINRDKGNSHTVTAYHPSVGRPMRIPEGAEPWDSGYLLPGETFSLTLTTEGVYDYYCVPHEHAGMVGRIVVGDAPAGERRAGTEPSDLIPLPDVAVDSLPSVAEIVATGRINQR